MINEKEMFEQWWNKHAMFTTGARDTARAGWLAALEMVKGPQLRTAIDGALYDLGRYASREELDRRVGHARKQIEAALGLCDPATCKHEAMYGLPNSKAAIECRACGSWLCFETLQDALNKLFTPLARWVHRGPAHMHTDISDAFRHTWGLDFKLNTLKASTSTHVQAWENLRKFVRELYPLQCDHANLKFGYDDAFVTCPVCHIKLKTGRANKMRSAYLPQLQDILARAFTSKYRQARLDQMRQLDELLKPYGFKDASICDADTFGKFNASKTDAIHPTWEGMRKAWEPMTTVSAQANWQQLQDILSRVFTPYIFAPFARTNYNNNIAEWLRHGWTIVEMLKHGHLVEDRATTAPLFYSCCPLCTSGDIAPVTNGPTERVAYCKSCRCRWFI